MHEDEVIDNLGTYLEQLVADDRFSGTVLVAKDASILFKHAYGWASQDFEVPNQVDTKLNLGSMNKMFTGVAIAQFANYDPPAATQVADWLQERLTQV